MYNKYLSNFIAYDECYLFAPMLHKYQALTSLLNLKDKTMLGYAYYEGRIVNRDVSKAIEYFSLSNDLEASSALASIYIFDEEYQNYSLAQKILKENLDANDPVIFTLFGYINELGLGVNKDLTKAVNYYQLAEDQDFKYAKYRRAFILSSQGVKDMAINYYKDAADNGVIKAMYNLSILYHKLDKTEEGNYYLRSAAKNGYPKAQFYLAIYLYQGRYFIEDEDESFKWMKKAAENGYRDAILRLSYYYDHGVGCAKDEGLADKYLEELKSLTFKKNQ